MSYFLTVRVVRRNLDKKRTHLLTSGVEDIHTQKENTKKKTQEKRLPSTTVNSLIRTPPLPSFRMIRVSSFLQNPDNGINVLSKFVYVPGDINATTESEEVLITTTEKGSSVHTSGWVGFKPSSYGAPEVNGTKLETRLFFFTVFGGLLPSSYDVVFDRNREKREE